MLLKEFSTEYDSMKTSGKREDEGGRAKWRLSSSNERALRSIVGPGAA